MRAPRKCLGILGTLTLAALPAHPGAQVVGSEFQVNTYTTSFQRTVPLGGHLVAGDATGRFVVIWRSSFQDGDSYGIFGQRYEAAGGTLGSEFRVNSYTPSSQAYGSVAAAADGSFVVVWRTYGLDGNQNGIIGQRYDNAGETLGSEFVVNSYTTNQQSFPSIAASASESFVVVWQSRYQDGDGYGIFGQRYDSEGVAQGSEFRVNSYTTSNQRMPSVASDASGNFVVVWQSQGQDGSGYGIFGQRYDSTGMALGTEFRVNSLTNDQQRYASVAAAADFRFVVVWGSNLHDGDGFGVFGQRYDSAGDPQGSEFRANSFTAGAQHFPSVASDSDGSFVVVWNSWGQDGAYYGVFGQHYDSSGAAQGDELQINSFTTFGQRFPSVATIGTNQFVVVWESGYQDGSFLGVFGQRLDFNPDTTPPSVTVAAPNGGEKLFTGSSYLIQWAASDDRALSSFDVSVSVDGGGSFVPIAECQGLPDTATSCLWVTPGPPSMSALVRVTAEDTSGNSASDDSDAVFRIVNGTASITVTNPNTNVRWRIGSRQTIRWNHNLGLKSAFRVELDRNNDGTFEELIAAAAPATNPTSGSFAWTVTGPPTPTARMRVSWTGNPAVSDVSDVTFRIAGQSLSSQP